MNVNQKTIGQSEYVDQRVGALLRKIRSPPNKGPVLVKNPYNSDSVSDSVCTGSGSGSFVTVTGSTTGAPRSGSL